MDPGRVGEDGCFRTRVNPDTDQSHDSSIRNPQWSDSSRCRGTPADSRVQTNPGRTKEHCRREDDHRGGGKSRGTGGPPEPTRPITIYVHTGWNF